ncbi:PIN domain-containing protein [Candidatus Woesearchaeota archaeon]|nr:PIN domain-containing protein [Candidatus Woesearchaeota archaeon]
MENLKTLFFDTYAFFEVIEGNKRYMPYAKGIAIITTTLNLMELHYGLLVKKGKEIADTYYYGLLNFAVTISDEVIIQANEFRASERREGKHLSYVDCIGYVLAKSRNIKFLTGDKEFAGLGNVEYVK